MPQYTWSAKTKERWNYWPHFNELLDICQDHDGPIVNKDWLDDELLAVGQIELSEKYIEMFKSRNKYANPNHSSLAYFLGLTEEVPTQYPVGLQLDRGRESPPDVDLDFDDRERARVIQYAREKYGTERVAHICTFSTLGSRSSIKDAGRVLGYDFSVRNDLANLVPMPVLGVTKTLDQALAAPDMRQAYETDPDAKKILDAAKGLEGLVRQPGIHAAGVVIAQRATTDFVPVMRKPNKDGTEGPIVTQWAMEEVERCGVLKIDFLGLRNLGVIGMCIDNIAARTGETIDVDAIPIDDALTFKELCAGNSSGVFQLESGGMREMMLALQPNNIADIMALISLYRPGPLGSGMDKMFIARKSGRSTIKYDHPVLKEVLEPSYGIMLYQEDVLGVARVLAGFSPGEADDLRKAIGKKQMDKIGAFREKFVQGCRDTHSVDPSTANKIYSDIEFFGGYGFNRAHAASYAMVSYITAYLKSNYPADYMASLLSSIDDQKKASAYLNECRRIGIRVTPPSINRSSSKYTVVSEQEILFGLASISGVGPAIVSSIISSRSDTRYCSIYDFMRRCNPEVLNKSAIEHLIRSGALDELIPDQPQRLLGRQDKLSVLDTEKKELGLYITEHPLSGVWHMIDKFIDVTAGDLDEIPTGEYLKVGGIITEVIRRTTKRGDVMFNITLEDLTGPIDIVCFPKSAKHHMDSFHEGEIVIIEGRVSKEGDDEHPVTKIFFTDIIKPEISEHETGVPINLLFPEAPSNAILEKITWLIDRTPGDSPVFIEFPQDRHLITLRMRKPTSLSIENELNLVSLGERSGVL